MPSEDGEFKYRIKSPNESHERVANENELSAIELPSLVPPDHHMMKPEAKPKHCFDGVSTEAGSAP
jgi:hypothetical protein